MKILFVHNNYGKYSGEESVVDKMSDLFKLKGHEVSFYRLTTEGMRDSLTGKVKGFLAGIYSPQGVNQMKKVLDRVKPDVVNVHNLYPFISPATLFECKKRGIPVIMTIHNFRLMCPTGLFMRNEAPCELCLENGNEWRCIRYNCEHSWLKSIGYALRNTVARKIGAYTKCVDRFACITNFQRIKLIQAGFSPSSLVVIPNAMDAENSCDSIIGSYIAFAGRLSTEKGVDMIVEVARRHPEIPFKLAGAVRDKQIIENLPSNVELMGYLKGDALNSFYKRARFFVMASKWYEGFPISILEAAKFGKATIGPDHGGFTEIIGSDDEAIGRLFKPADMDELEKQVVDLWNHPEECERLGQLSFQKLKNQYCTEVIYQQWMDLINSIVKQ